MSEIDIEALQITLIVAALIVAGGAAWAAMHVADAIERLRAAKPSAESARAGQQ